MGYGGNSGLVLGRPRLRSGCDDGDGPRGRDTSRHRHRRGHQLRLGSDLFSLIPRCMCILYVMQPEARRRSRHMRAASLRHLPRGGRAVPVLQGRRGEGPKPSTGGEWEPIKISSKFESSAYVPKSPNPSSVLTKVWSSY